MAICLRMPDNAKQVMEAGGAQLLTQILKTHLDSSPKVPVSFNYLYSKTPYFLAISSYKLLGWVGKIKLPGSKLESTLRN